MNFAFYGQAVTTDRQEARRIRDQQVADAAARVAAVGGQIVRDFFDVYPDRHRAWRHRRHARRLLAELADPEGRGFDAIIVSDTRTVFGSSYEYDLILWLCGLRQAQLWVPEIEGPVVEDHVVDVRIMMELFWGMAPPWPPAPQAGEEWRPPDGGWADDRCQFGRRPGLVGCQLGPRGRRPAGTGGLVGPWVDMTTTKPARNPQLRTASATHQPRPGHGRHCPGWPGTGTGRPVRPGRIVDGVRDRRLAAGHRVAGRCRARVRCGTSTPVGLVRQGDRDVGQPPSPCWHACRPDGRPQCRTGNCSPRVGESRYRPAPTAQRPGNAWPRGRRSEEGGSGGQLQPVGWGPR